MTTVDNHRAAHLKLHLLSEGITFSNEFLKAFSEQPNLMEKRHAYNNSDDAHINTTMRTPQEIFIGDVVIAMNHQISSPWRLEYDEDVFFLSNYSKPITQISFPKRPRFLDLTLSNGVLCGSVANIYGGSSIAFFTPSSCYYFAHGTECRFCSLKPTRNDDTIFVHTITPQLATSVLSIAFENDAQQIRQIMLVGGNIPNYDTGFKKHLEIVKSLEEKQRYISITNKLETHLATMPPDNFRLLDEVKYLNARITMNLEVFDDDVFEAICPGKAKNYGRTRLKNSLEYAAKKINGRRVHTILMVGLESIESTITGIKFLPSIGVTPIINVFHSDRGSHFEHHSRASYEELLEVALTLEGVYQKNKLVPYWKGCGRNALDFEALNGWFSGNTN